MIIMHIVAGLTALVAGAAALASRKGGRLHRRSGQSLRTDAAPGQPGRLRLSVKDTPGPHPVDPAGRDWR